MDTRSGALVVLAQQGALLRRNLRKPIPIESRRIALERMITLDFPHCGAYFAEYSSNISMTGMFIRTDRIQAPGTLVKLEFSLSDDSSLIESQAEVVWVRRRHESPDRPSGLGLRFVDLDKESRHLIRWAVEQRLRDGRSTPSDESERTAAGASDGESKQQSSGSIGLPTQGAGSLRGAKAPRETATSPQENKPPQNKRSPREGKIVSEAKPSPDKGGVESRLESYAGARAVQDTGNRRGWLVWVALTGLIASVLFFVFKGDEPEAAFEAVEPASAVADEAMEAVVETRDADVRAVVEEPPAPAEVPGLSPRPLDEIATVIASWAEAWSMQRTDSYLEFYAESYRPTGGLSVVQWREQRRERITAPRRIEVGISDLEVQLLESERARATFSQSYRSDRYQDRTLKTLELVLENGRWKIQNERSET